MKRTLILSLAIAICLGSAALASAQVPCLLNFFSQLPPHTPMAVGPNVYQAALTVPGVTEAILGARDAWNVTEAAGRLDGWTGVVSGSDCPLGQPMQIGAFDFNAVGCPTVNAYGAQGALAFVDYFPSQCAGCGTKSISVNTANALALNPLPGQYDIQSILAHEFGHVLGLAHMTGQFCSSAAPARCVQDPNRNTMGSVIWDGEACERDLAYYDSLNANVAY
jgi:hypothetical protein